MWVAAALFADLEVVAAGRACLLRLSGEPLVPEAEERVALALRDSDRMAERLRAEPP